jgi:HAD superfamily hydrolase (TIGR01450 family)
MYKKIANDNLYSKFVGVILAAGVGSRLRPMTNTIPKCMVKTAGKVILEYQIDAYRDAGIEELIIVVGYEGQSIRNYCKNIKDIKISIIDNNDYENTNNMYSYYLASKIISDRPFILNNADLVIESSIIKILLDSGDDSAVAIDSSQFFEESMKVSINQDGYIADISKIIDKKSSAGCSIDFYKFSSVDGSKFSKFVAEIIEEQKNLKDWTEVALQKAFQCQYLKFKTVDVSGLNWVEIDNYVDLALSDRLFSKINEKLKLIKLAFIDLDGTIYNGADVIDGAAVAISHLKDFGIKVYFLSNNSSKSKTDYILRLREFGIETSIDDIIISYDAVLEWLSTQGVERVHVLGTNSFKKVIVDSGFVIDSLTPEYVVIGYDTELDYAKLVEACSYVNDGVEIIATHCDMFCPSELGPIPDIGALLEMIRLTTGVKPRHIFGKPNKIMVESVINHLQIDPSQVLFVGDRIYTDIQMAKNMGAQGLLVLTGDTARDVCQESLIQPDYILNSIAELTLSKK